MYVKTVSRVPYGTELRVLGMEEIRVPPILRPSESSQDSGIVREKLYNQVQVREDNGELIRIREE